MRKRTVKRRRKATPKRTSNKYNNSTMHAKCVVELPYEYRLNHSSGSDTTSARLQVWWRTQRTGSLQDQVYVSDSPEFNRLRELFEFYSINSVQMRYIPYRIMAGTPNHEDVIQMRQRHLASYVGDVDGTFNYDMMRLQPDF